VTLLPQSEKVYLDGASHIVEQPEFKDMNKLYHLLRCLEEKTNIMNLLSADLDERLTIHIGSENKSRYLNDCSVVTRGYGMRGRPAGRVGVIGPRRMVYEKVIPTVEFLADTLSKMLTEVEV
jgi:heat-inducible transcriptional repressor